MFCPCSVESITITLVTHISVHFHDICRMSMVATEASKLLSRHVSVFLF